MIFFIFCSGNTIAKIKSLGIVFCLGCVFSCSKPEGEGGGAKISGRLFQNVYAPSGMLITTEPAIEQRVYVLYGSNTFPDDDVDTDINGNFQFKYLRKGNYTLFSYSDCSTCPGNKDTVSWSVAIVNNRSDIVTNDMFIRKSADYNDGNGTISGVILLQDYLGNTPYGAPYAGSNVDVYIAYGTLEPYFDRMDSDPMGTYKFLELLEGSYTIFAYSDCLTCPGGSDSLSTVVMLEKGGVGVADTLILKNQI